MKILIVLWIVCVVSLALSAVQLVRALHILQLGG